MHDAVVCCCLLRCPLANTPDGTITTWAFAAANIQDFALGAMILCNRGLSPHPIPGQNPTRPRYSVRADAGNGCTNGAAPRAVQSDLRTVPGVGKRNKELLMQQQVQNVQALTLQFEQRGRDKDSMLEWLAKDVGIRRHHGNAIVNYLAHELGSVGQQGGARCNVTLAVEGNIRCVVAAVISPRPLCVASYPQHNNTAHAVLARARCCACWWMTA